ncbi:MAG: ABC transporter ATP-binding protein [Alphaproteobacteria bacterium]|nr:ABC transporter ATP-binding protein [Alphaproteobacteria bacterium]
MSEPLIVLKTVTKSYTRGKQSVPIFERLDMNIPTQDFVAIMGPSGSGKTTLLNLLGGIDKPSGGEIVFDGKRMDNLDESRLAGFRAGNVGFIFQFYNLMPMLTAAQNVELPLLLTKLGPRARAERVKTALEIVGLSDRARHKPSELSGGQQQRVAIARAIVSDPKLLLCDEPTGDLDRETAGEILSMLQTLNRDLGKTIVMVTHDPEAARYAKRTLHLDKGHFSEKDLAA